MRTWRATTAGVPVALLVLAACGGDPSPAGTITTTATATSATGAPPSSPSDADAQRVEVTETEFSIALSRTDFTPGTYTFAVDNKGSASHDLAIRGPGVDEAKTQVLGGGARGEVTVTLQPGTYELWCTVGNHRARGMQLQVSVSG